MGGPIWGLIVHSINNGTFGPPTMSDISKPNLRLILPWAPLPYARTFDLRREEDQHMIRTVILPLVVAERETLFADPERLQPRVARVQQEQHDAQMKVRRERVLAKAIAALPSTEHPLMAYGEQLWPVIDRSVRYTYRDLLEACWFYRAMLGDFRFCGSPREIMMTVNKLLKWLPLRDTPFADAVRKIGAVYDKTPDGPCDWESPPTNYGA
jgi:hypothetical protein